MSEKKWEFKRHGYQIANTGDYTGYYEIKYDDISICTKDDEEDTPELIEVIVNKLNESNIKFYTDVSLKYENELIREENLRMLEALVGLLTQEEVFDILYKTKKEHEKV